MTSPTLKNKVSPHIQEQLPEYVKSDPPLFSLFLKYYYEFLESGELTVSGSNDYVIEETISKNYILDEQELKVVLESSAGKFTAGETIVGSKSKATARVLVDDFDSNNRLFITSQQRFETGETITGSSSGATTTVVSYRANPVQNIQQLLEYADVDNTVYSFLDKFRDSLMESIPNTLAEGTEKRKLIKSIKDLYAAKGTEDAHKLFFRILFNEEAELIYPRDNLIRSSDGEWSTDKVIRIVENGNSDFTSAIGEFITGSTSGATAILITVIKFREGATDIAELSLDENSIVGDFVEGEIITSTDISRDLEIAGTIKGIVTGLSVTNRGSYYNIGDTVNIKTGGNNAATARIESISPGSVNEILIEDGGTGYTIGDNLVFNLTGTEGSSVQAKVAVVGGGISLEQTTSPDSIVTENDEKILTIAIDNFELEDSTLGNSYLSSESGDYIVLEDDSLLLTETDALEYAKQEGTSTDLTGDIIMEDGKQLLREDADIFFSSLETTVGEVDNLVLEDGTQIILEPRTFTDLGVAAETGEITKVEVVNSGNGFLKTPLVTVSSTTGSGAELYACSTSEPKIGAIGDVSITNFGLDYTIVPEGQFNRNFIIKNYTGTFSAGDTLTSHVGEVVNFDATRNLLIVRTDVTLDEGDVLTTITGATATIVQGDFATGTVEIGTVGTTVGDFQSERGKPSVDSMKVQDSFYYQDYSYVVRVGESINQWRDSIRRSVHPAGWNVFGEVSFASQVSATIQVPAAGSIADFTGDDTFSPELASTFTNLFTTIFGRRLGTVTDGTSLVSAPVTGYSDISDIPNGRDVTLTSDVSVRMNLNRGSHYSGSTLENVAMFGFTADPHYEDTFLLMTEDDNHLLQETGEDDAHHGESAHQHFVQEFEHEAIPHYPGIYRTPTLGKDFSRDQYSLAQIGRYRINELSEPDGSGGYRIPLTAYSTIINIPPPSEIIITRTGLTNAFDNNFATFDRGDQTFDESGGTRDTAARYTDSFDQNDMYFDSSNTKFDRAAGEDEQLFSRTSTKFDNGTIRFDNQIGGLLTYDQIDISMDSNAYTLDETL